MNEPVSAATLRLKTPQAPVDPNLSIPKSVRDQAKRAEIIQQAVVGEAEPSLLDNTALTPPNGQTPPTVQSPQTPPAQPTSEAAPPPQAPSPPQPSAPPPVQPAAAPPEVVPPEEWERRFNSMKGRFDQLMEQVNILSEQNQRLRTELTVRPPPPAPNGHAPQPQSLISEQEMQDYGPEFVDLVRRAATEIAAPLQEEIQQLRGQLGHVQTETSNAFLTRMHATIGGLVPNWQDLNRDPRFIAWVNLPDIYSGVMRQELMQSAWNSGDANRVAAFFRAFLNEEAAVDPRAGQRAPQPPPPTAPAGMPAAVPGVTLGTRLSLDQLATPGRAQSSAQMPADKPVYTAQQITRFYTDVAAGKWRTREAERAAIDADIIAAQHEGRIIPDQRSIRPMDWNGNR